MKWFCILLDFFLCFVSLLSFILFLLLNPLCNVSCIFKVGSETVMQVGGAVGLFVFYSISMSPEFLIPVIILVSDGPTVIIVERAL
jgi:hypothetical protein